MVAPLYPSDLPGVSEFRIVGVPQPISTGDGIGPKDFKRITKLTTSTAKVAWRFLEDDFSTFSTWWEDDLLNGHKRFFIQLPSAAGLMWHLCRFIGPYAATRENYAHWQVIAELEVDSRATSTVTPY